MKAALVYDTEKSVTMSSLRSRHPAQAVMEKTLAEQQRAKPRSPLARLFGVSPLTPDSMSWYLGARGELQVGEILTRLPECWTSFHSLPVGKKDSDIDHVVIGPAGVFTINTKRHRAKKIWVAGSWVLVDGQKKTGYIPAAEYEAKRVERMLAASVDFLPPVRPILAFVEPGRMTVRRRPDIVTVLSAKHLARWLASQPVVWCDEQRWQAVRAMDAISVPEVSAESAGGAAVIDRFRALDADVRRADTRRAVWALAAAAGIVASVGAVPSLLPLLT